MPAGFEFGGQTFLGTNGAVSAYVEALAQLAAEQCGPADALSVFLSEEAEGFFTGKIVFLTDVLPDKTSRDTFLFLLAAATDQVRDEFTEYGRSWIDSTMRALSERIATSGK